MRRAGAMVLLAVLVNLVAVAPDARAATPGPPATPTASSWYRLDDVACPSAHMCIGIGSEHTRTHQTMIAFVGRDGVWSTVHLPVPAGYTLESIDAHSLSCTAVLCAAIVSLAAQGRAAQALLASGAENTARDAIVVWDRGSWTTVLAPPAPPQLAPTPTPRPIRLSNLTCATSGCLAVGTYTATDQRTPPVAVTIRSGAIDTITPLPLPADTDWTYPVQSRGGSYVFEPTANQLWCANGVHCVIGGAYATTTGPQVLAWFGQPGQWQMATTPAPPGTQQLVADAVTCTDVTDCVIAATWATTPLGGLGEVGTPMFVRATSQGLHSALPRPALETPVHALACPTSDVCYAGASPAEGAVVITGQQDTWSTATAPLVDGAPVAVSSLRCAATTCLGVGTAWPALTPPSAETSRGAIVTLADRTWRAQAITVPAGVRAWHNATQLDHLACTTARRCLAIGTYYPQSGTDPSYPNDAREFVVDIVVTPAGQVVTHSLALGTPPVERVSGAAPTTTSTSAGAATAAASTRHSQGGAAVLWIVAATVAVSLTAWLLQSVQARRRERQDARATA